MRRRRRFSGDLKAKVALEARTVTPSRARELAELQDENARLHAEAMNREVE